MNSQKVSFENGRGETLSARLDLPLDQRPVACAIFAHCFTCSKNFSAVRNISRALNQNGIAVLRFDFTGLGESEGEFEETSFSTNVDDLVTAANFMNEQFDEPAMLIGHSLGGAAVLHAARRIPDVKAVVTIGAPAEPAHVKHLFQDSIDEIKETGKARVNIGGRDFDIRKEFVDDLNSTDGESLIRGLRLPLLIMHSPQDTIVGIENAAAIYTAAWHPKSFISLDGADHLLSDKADSEYAGSVIASWAKRYLPRPESDDLSTKELAVVRTGNESYTTDILVNDFPLTADEPLAVGGNNFGPTPYGLLTASLGACTTMTLQMYARRKGWDLQEVVVHLNHEKDHSADCKNCESAGAKIDHFERIIELHGNLDDTQRQRLMEIADKCPVHKTLHSEVVINTRLAATGGLVK